MKSQVLHTVWCLYFWWGCRGNVKLITLGSERVNPLLPCTHSCVAVTMVTLLYLCFCQYIRSCVAKGQRPLLRRVPVSSLDLEPKQVFQLDHIPPLPPRDSEGCLSLWDIKTHFRIKIVSAGNVNAGDDMKVSNAQVPNLWELILVTRTEHCAMFWRLVNWDQSKVSEMCLLSPGLGLGCGLGLG